MRKPSGSTFGTSQGGGIHACKTCNHPDRAEIEAQLAARVELRPLAKRYGIGYTALSRHRTKHMNSADYATLHSAAQAPNGNSAFLDKQAADIADLEKFAAKAQGTQKLAAMKELRAARREQALASAPATIGFDFRQSREWLDLRTLILEVLTAFPAAKRALFTRLQEYDETGPVEESLGERGLAGVVIPKHLRKAAPK